MRIHEIREFRRQRVLSAVAHAANDREGKARRRGALGEAVAGDGGRLMSDATGAPVGDSHWPLWEVFTQENQGQPFEHAG
ncbi:MAG: hypothetical protein ACO3QC_14620, partial [Phycisphaerales bacterium]